MERIEDNIINGTNRIETIILLMERIEDNTTKFW